MTQVKAVALIIKNRAGEILLIQRGAKARSHHGQWENVGGAVERGETPEEAIRREVKEEIGVKIAELHSVLEMDDVQTDGQVWKAVVFEGKISGEPMIQEPEKIQAFQWFSLQKLQHVDLTPYAKEDFVKLGWISH